MKRKPIKIDWSELEEVFSTPQEDAVFYLDSVTGRISLEGEGDVEPEDEDETFDQTRPVAGSGPAVLRDDPTRILIDPPDIDTKIDWMTDFLTQHGASHGAAAVDDLNAAIDADDPAEALGEALHRHPAVRDAWYLFRTDRLHDLIDAWLEDNDIQCTDRPPWTRQES